MENINNNYIVKTSESVSSYSSCYEDEQISSGKYTKIKTSKKKSRLCLKNFLSDDDLIYKENVVQRKPCKNIDQSSTATLCVVVQKQKIFGKHRPLDRFSEELHPLKYSSHQPHEKDKFKVRPNNKYTSSAIKVSSQIVQTSITHCTTTLWENRHPRTDTSLKLNAILSVDTSDEEEKAEFLREWQVQHLLNEFKRDEKYSCNESIALNEPSKNKSESFTNNSTHEEYNDSDVNYELMARCLQNSSSSMKKFDILQSLLLRLSSQESDERHATIQAIVDNDLFGIKNGIDTILKNLLWPINVRTPHPLQISTAKLLNALVSYQIGREYFSHISMVSLLTWSKIEQIYESMADNLMAVMMKLSLNHFQRCDMLRNGLLQWLINHMEEVEFSASTFHLECMTDLLRMLMEVDSLSEFSFVKIPQLIIVLVRYLNIENEYVKINICHALRALLQNRTAIEIGNKIHLHRIIQDHIKKTTNSKLKEDLQCIYKLITKYIMSKSNKLGSSSMDDQGFKENNDDQRMLKTRSENLWKNKPLSENEIGNNDEELMLITENTDYSENNLCDITSKSDDDTEYLSTTERDKNEQRSETLDQILTADLSSYILQVCLDKELTEKSRRSKIEDNTCKTVINKRSNTSALQSCTEYKGSKQSANIDVNTDVIFHNLNWNLKQSSSFLSRPSQLSSGEIKVSSTKLKKKGDKRMAIDMEDMSKSKATDTTPQLQSSKASNVKPTGITTDYLDLNSIAKDPNARNEILENDSFIDELCEKVFDKLREKIFCGANCNTDCCKRDDGAKQN